MLTLHITETEHAVTIPRDEFLKLIDRFQTLEPIKIIEDEDPDYLTAEEIKIRAEAMEELEAGETVDFCDVKNQWLKGESTGI